MNLFDFLPNETKTALEESLKSAFGDEAGLAIFSELGSKAQSEVARGLDSETTDMANAAQNVVNAATGVWNGHSWYTDGYNAGVSLVNGLKSATSHYGGLNMDGNIAAPLIPQKKYASGGYPERGEMIGRMGNRSVVANNNQIVSGIASGVASANSEQNALLREQNALLRQLLQKEVKAELVPSAALGRIDARSAALYEKAFG